jgi:cyclic beta-1,2-glucan synthetase
VYISTVDSGNLAGHLLTLQAGLTGLYDQPVLGPQIVDGIVATCRVLEETLAGTTPAQAPAAQPATGVGATAAGTSPSNPVYAEQDAESGADPRDIKALLAALTPAPDTANLQQLHGWLNRVADAADHYQPQAAGQGEAAAMWAAALVRQCRAALAELAALTPWAGLPPDTVFDTSMTRMPTLRELAAMAASSAAVPVTDLAPAELERRLQLAGLCEQGAVAAHERMRALAELGQRSGAYALMEYPLPVQRHHRPAGHRLQRVSDRRLDPATTTCWPPKCDWPASSASPRAAAAGALVRAGPPAVHRRRRAGAAVLERLDVRVPDAVAGDADLSRTRCSTRPTAR